MKLQPNELVIKSGKATMCSSNGVVKLILTNQGRIYLDDKPFSDFEEITYFDRNIFQKDGVILITKKGKTIKFLVKNRKKWEKLFSKLY